MAEETSTAPAEAADVSATVQTPAVKKTRAPRQKKAVATPAEVTSEAVAAAVPAKAPVGRGRKAKPVAAAPAVAATPIRAKRAPKAVAKPKAVPVAVLEGVEDLIKLEDDNRQLRKLLAEKLRSENADLRRRLGHA